MDRTELESAAARVTYLRGGLAVPAGILFAVTGIANLRSGLPGDPVTFPVLAVLWAVATWVINRSYNVHYGRVRLSREQQVRYGISSMVLFGVPLVAGPVLDFRLDLPVSLFAILFGLGMLAWFAICVGLRRHHIVVWGGLIAIGLVPMWGGLADRASAGWLPIGIATVIAGAFDHLTLARVYGPTEEAHAEV